MEFSGRVEGCHLDGHIAGVLNACRRAGPNSSRSVPLVSSQNVVVHDELDARQVSWMWEDFQKSGEGALKREELSSTSKLIVSLQT